MKQANFEVQPAELPPTTIRLEHAWYDTPAYETGRWVLAFRIRMPQSSFGFYLTEPEMRDALLQLQHHGYGPDGVLVKDDRVENEVWWDYGQVNEDGVTFLLGNDTVNEVPVILYRDDHCYALVPHRIGLEMVEIIQTRLCEMNDPAFLANLKEEQLKRESEFKERLDLSTPG